MAEVRRLTGCAREGGVRRDMAEISKRKEGADVERQRAAEVSSAGSSAWKKLRTKKS